MEAQGRRNRVKLSFDEVGPLDAGGSGGGRPPILFLHGLTSAKESWKDVIRPIAAATGRKAYAYDARNHGDSGWSELDFGYDVMVEDLLELMEGLRLTKAVLVGHSMGGKVAAYFALRWPEKVERLVMEDISPKPSGPEARAALRQYLRLLESALSRIPEEERDLERAKRFVDAILQDSVPQDGRSGRHGLAAHAWEALPLALDEASGKFRWKTHLGAIEAQFLAAPSRTRSGLYRGPTLVLYGTRSPYKVSGDRDYIRGLFPDCQLRAVEGATHSIHAEYADVFVKEVAEFINDS